MQEHSADNNRIIMPRIIRMRDAPFYLGMNKNLFNSEVRPSLTEIRIGRQGIAFDRHELDAWVDQYKQRVCKPSKFQQNKENHKWQKRRLASSKEANIGTSTKLSEADAFAKALVQATYKKHKVS